ncbi:MAG: hypothetical protein A2178_00595 [Planctomycetes bacterium GWC2_49_10]|nr:MAG: hypothetical protein A2178_00595 [Planctomycetes bacterium GWC2_49_10]
MRGILKCALFIALEYIGINAFFRFCNRGKIKVLMYHSISPPGPFFNNAVPESSFIRQLNYLSKHYAILKLSQDGQFSGYAPKKVNVLLTFDDGFRDNYTTASLILSRLGLSGVFFVIAECLQNGSPPLFIKSRLGQLPETNAYRTLTSSEAQEMIRMGMTIGSHGQHHSDYTKVTFEDGMKDALDSKSHIEKEVGMPVELFAFPWGKYQERHLVELMSAYRRIFTTHHGFNSRDDFVFHRNEIANTPHLWCATSGALDFLIGLFSVPFGINMKKAGKLK